MRLKLLKWKLYSAYHIWKGRRIMKKRPAKQKVFCVGLNKTGTTSWTAAMDDLGYLVCNERACEIYFDAWLAGSFGAITRLCDAGDAFQDIPFCLPNMPAHLHQTFPDAKFILTIRDSPAQWYQSVSRFHGKRWGGSGHCIPTPDDLKRSTYIYAGWPAKFCREVFQTSEDDPYNEERLLNFYVNYNRQVKDYFSAFSDSLLTINISHPGSLKKMCAFLDISYPGGEFPWKNKT